MDRNGLIWSTLLENKPSFNCPWLWDVYVLSSAYILEHLNINFRN